MPENETLLHNGRNASRWRPVSEHLDRGKSPTKLFPEIEHQFYTLLQKVWKRWKRHGVDPGQLFHAALTDPQAMRDLIKQMSFDQNARLLQEVAANIQDTDNKRLIRDFL